MNNQQDKIDKIFERTRSTEPELDNSVFTNRIMQRIDRQEVAVSERMQYQSAILWLAGLIGAILAISLFPVNEFLQLLNTFSDGVTVPQIGAVVLMISAVAYSAFWIAETDSI